jgi:uncharacterized membrane protein (UPF0127 family)
MLLKPFIISLGGDRIAWLTLAMSSTLAGNFTLIGSVANLIVAQQARKRVEIGFFEYFRAGAIITAVTIAVGVLVLAAEVKVAQGAEIASSSPALRPKIVAVTRADPASPPRAFTVVLYCDSEAKRVRGLQGFRGLLAGEAALFSFDPPEKISFWMGTVSYSIDIIFVDAAGRVSAVYANLQPGSGELYDSRSPSRWVVETASGSGARVGDRIVVK